VHPDGEAVVAEFEWVHGLVRRDLATLRSLADDVAAGARAEHVEAQIESLAVKSPVWALRVNCLHYCSFVEAHHGLEDSFFFPRLRRVNPALSPAIDRLEHEHQVVAEHLDRIEASAVALSTDIGARAALVADLTRLADHLLGHLAFEEASIFPTLRSQGLPGR
jgi:iron-sulfur cluster repair protein YtfE (RIC family)